MVRDERNVLDKNAEKGNVSQVEETKTIIRAGDISSGNISRETSKTQDEETSKAQDEEASKTQAEEASKTQGEETSKTQVKDTFNAQGEDTSKSNPVPSKYNPDDPRWTHRKSVHDETTLERYGKFFGFFAGVMVILCICGYAFTMIAEYGNAEYDEEVRETWNSRYRTYDHTGRTKYTYAPSTRIERSQPPINTYAPSPDQSYPPPHQDYPPRQQNHQGW